MNKLMLVGQLMATPPYAAFLLLPFGVKAQLRGLAIQVAGLLLCLYCILHFTYHFDPLDPESECP